MLDFQGHTQWYGELASTCWPLASKVRHVLKQFPTPPTHKIKKSKGFQGFFLITHFNEEKDKDLPLWTKNDFISIDHM